jgi:putative heme iron utilization protein
MTNQPDAKADIETVRQAYQQLLSQTESLILATTNHDGTPRASYAPFIVDEQRQFYIFTSRLAAHTTNLQRTGQASIMVVEDEAAATQIFARQRVTFQCQANLVPPNSAEGEVALTQYEARFGKIVGLLKSLPDFQLFKLQPQSGTLVLGFGQAYELDGDRFEVIVHRERA